MGDVIFTARDASFRYRGARHHAVAGADLDVARGALLGVVGPNGSGKTTLLHLLLGVIRATGGTVSAFGRPAHEWRRRDLARRVAVVAQREEPVFPLRVREFVRLGRYPHAGRYGVLGAADEEAVSAALDRADASQLADRWTMALSGGEWQRVRLARALAQEPEVLVLDEATANLDLRHEMETFELVTGLVRDHGLTGVLVTHHVNLVARFASRLAVLHQGRVVAEGPPSVVLDREVVERVFSWPVEIVEWEGTVQVMPRRGGDQAGRRPGGRAARS